MAHLSWRTWWKSLRSHLAISAQRHQRLSLSCPETARSPQRGEKPLCSLPGPQNAGSSKYNGNRVSLFKYGPAVTMLQPGKGMSQHWSADHYFYSWLALTLVFGSLLSLFLWWIDLPWTWTRLLSNCTSVYSLTVDPVPAWFMVWPWVAAWQNMFCLLLWLWLMSPQFLNSLSLDFPLYLLFINSILTHPS